MRKKTSLNHLLDHKFLPIVLGPLVLFAPLLFGGKALIWGTPSTQFFPWWDFTWRSILSGELPLWNPLVGMGAPLAANYQVGLFYPPYWIYLIVFAIGGLEWMAYAATWMVCFHLIWSGIGMTVLLDKFRLKPIAQTIGGLAFSLSGYLVARAGFLSINAAAAWLPWVLLAAINLAEKKKNGFWVLTITMVFLLLAGHAQTAWYILLLGAAWLLYWNLQISPNGNQLRSTLIAGARYAGCALLAAGISAVQLLPTLEYLLTSQRSAEYGYAEAMTYSFWPWRLLALAAPDIFGNPAAGNYWGYGNYWEDAIYIGLFPLLLAISALVRSIGRRGRKAGSAGADQLPMFLGALLLASFVLALGRNTPVFPFLYKNIPTFDLFQAPTRWMVWGVFAMAFLAAIGADRLTPPQGKRLYFTRLAAAGFLAVSGGSFLAWRLLSALETTLFSATAKAGLIGFLTVILVLAMPPEEEGTKYRVWKGLAVLLVAFDLVSAGWGLNPGVKKVFYQHQGQEKSNGRYWMPADLEYDLKFEYFFRFDDFAPAGPWDAMLESYLPNTNMFREIEMVNNFDPILPGNYQVWMDNLNASPPDPDLLRLMDVSTVITGEPEKIQFESYPRREMDRLRIVGCAGVQESQEEVLDVLITDASEYYQDILIADKPERDCRIGARGTVSILEKKNGYLKLDADLDGDGWIFWSQTWYPGWRVKVDGIIIGDVVRANYLFQAAPVPSGKHQVELIFRPPSHIWGAGISALSAAIWVLGRRLIIVRKNADRRQGDERD